MAARQAATMITRSSATAEKQRVSYARLSRLAHWSCTSLNTASVVQLYTRLAKVATTLSANKPWDIRGRWSFQTLYTFKVICLCIIRKPLIAFVIMHITNGHTSQDLWKMMPMYSHRHHHQPSLAAHLQFVAPSAVNPCENSYKTHNTVLKSLLIGHIVVTDS